MVFPVVEEHVEQDLENILQHCGQVIYGKVPVAGVEGSVVKQRRNTP